MKITALIFVVLFCPLAANAALVYQLDPGSQITITETGVTETLTGTFTWEFEANIGPHLVMVPTGLSFQSDSVSISLDPDGGLGTSVFFENDPTRCLGDICLSFFNALINISGLATVNDETEYGFSSFGNGGYEGDPFAPDRVFYDGLALIPESGGSSAATIQFSASLAPVPVPAPLMLLGSGLVTLIAATRRRSQQKGSSL